MSSDAFSGGVLLPPFRSADAFATDPEQFSTYAAPDPQRLERRAKDLLNDRMGRTDVAVSTGYACGTVGVQADQTHYSDGFGLFLPLQQGVAVAARPADDTRITFAGDEKIWTDESSAPPPWVVAVRRILQVLLSVEQAEVALVSTVPGVCRDGYMAAMAVSVMRVARALEAATVVDLNTVATLRDELVPLFAGEIGSALECPYSSGYLLATFAGHNPAFTLVDTATREHLPVETEARDALEWAVIDLGDEEARPSTFHRHRRDQAREALRILRSNGFEDLVSFRELEHQDLGDALAALPDALQPVVRHLVTENRRVQKHVAAMRRSDWQMIGALLLMSHASQRDHWKSTVDAVDTVVAEAETRTHDGLYGACMTGRSGAVLVAGRPGSFDQELRHLADRIAPRIDGSPRFLRP